jgi:hypothetical protein
MSWSLKAVAEYRRARDSGLHPYLVRELFKGWGGVHLGLKAIAGEARLGVRAGELPPFP